MPALIVAYKRARGFHVEILIYARLSQKQ